MSKSFPQWPIFGVFGTILRLPLSLERSSDLPSRVYACRPSCDFIRFKGSSFLLNICNTRRISTPGNFDAVSFTVSGHSPSSSSRLRLSIALVPHRVGILVPDASGLFSPTSTSILTLDRFVGGFGVFVCVEAFEITRASRPAALISSWMFAFLVLYQE